MSREIVEADVEVNKASLSGIFWSFFKIGAFTFGGGWAMVPLIRKELVENRKWLEDSEFVDVLAIAQSGPGPIAINTSVISGYKMKGLPGAVAATLGSSLPSFLVILAVATVFIRIQSSTWVEAFFRGIRPAVFGLLASAVWQVGSKSVKTRRDLIFALLGAFMLLVLKQSPVLTIFVAGILGIIVGQVERSRNSKKSHGVEDGTKQ